MSRQNLMGILLLILFTSCLKREEFSEIPKIEYRSMTVEGNDIELRISFTDGDGDIGFREGEEQFPFGPCDEYHYNLLIDPFYLKDGEYVIGTVLDYDSKCYPKSSPDTGYFPDTVGYYYRVAYLVPDGKDKSLEGDIYITLNEVLNEFPDDTIKFSIYLIDRALHRSNVVQTEALITP
ncbi:MAG: hypothetical protein RIC15_04380 [Vicingaceae bacterium]